MNKKVGYPGQSFRMESKRPAHLDKDDDPDRHVNNVGNYNGYTPEMIRQAQLQMQALQQMRMGGGNGNGNGGGGGANVVSNGNGGMQQSFPVSSLPTAAGVGRPSTRPINNINGMMYTGGGKGGGGGRPVMNVGLPMPSVMRAPAITTNGLVPNRPIMTTFSPYSHPTSPTISLPSRSTESSQSSTLANGVVSTATSNAGTTSYSQQFDIHSLPIFSQLYTVPPYDRQMDEMKFLDSLNRFMTLLNCPIKKIPQIRPGTPLPLHKLFQLVVGSGGYRRVCEGNKWTAAAISLEISPITPESVAFLQRLYVSLLFSYEQVFIAKIPLDKVIWPPQIIQQHLNRPLSSANISFEHGNNSIDATMAKKAMVTEAVKSEKSKQDIPLALTPSFRPLQQTVKKEHYQQPQQPQQHQYQQQQQQQPQQQQQQHHQQHQQNQQPLPLTPQSNLPIHSQQQQQSSPPRQQPQLSPPQSQQSIEDPLIATLKTTKVKRITKNLLNFGKTSFEEITLMMISGIDYLEVLGLCLLERISFDQNIILDKLVLNPLLDALLYLYTAELELLQEPKGKEDNDDMDCKNNDDTDCREDDDDDIYCKDHQLSDAILDTTEEENDKKDQQMQKRQKRIKKNRISNIDHRDRPFDLLIRIEEGKNSDLLLLSKDARLGKIKTIVSILKNWIVHEKDAKNICTIIATHPLASKVIVPALVRSRIWIKLDIEIYSQILLIFYRLFPYMSAIPDSKAIIELASEEIKACFDNQSRWAHILHPQLIFEETNFESFHRMLTRFISMLPPRCFMLIDLVGRVTTGLLDEQSSSPILGTINDLIEILWNGFVLLLPILFGHMRLTIRVLQSVPKTDKASYTMAIGKYLHNLNLGLDDGGYLELILQSLLEILKTCTLVIKPGKMIKSLLGVMNAIREAYVQFKCPDMAPFLVDSGEVEKRKRSILTMQPVQSNNSHPYRIFQLCISIITCLLDDHLGDNDDASGDDDDDKSFLDFDNVQMLIGWLSKTIDDPIHADLIQSTELLHIVNCLLLL